MKKLGLLSIKSNNSIFIDSKKSTIIALYIDNILIINLSKAEIQRIKKGLNAKFHISNLKLYIYYLSIIIKRDRYSDILRLE